MLLCSFACKSQQQQPTAKSLQIETKCIFQLSNGSFLPQVCQCFVFCALLEFALVNYASRSDMQRDRARERNERARRQWELEHADMEQMPPGSGPGPVTSGTGPGNNVSSMNHIGGNNDTIDGIPGFSLVCNVTIHS